MVWWSPSSGSQVVSRLRLSLSAMDEDAEHILRRKHEFRFLLRFI